MNKRAPRHSDEERHQIILAARASGLSDFEYCRNNSIPSSTFYRALARLRQQACELPARSERLECKREVVPINISELPISREDRMHPVSHVVDEPSPASFEATMRITFGTDQSGRYCTGCQYPEHVEGTLGSDPIKKK